jgi:hypothetical protein
MYRESRLTLKSAKELFASSIAGMQTDLQNYVNMPNHSERAVHFKKAQINNLQAVYNSFLEFEIDVNMELDDLYEKIKKQALVKQKLEACALVHGVPVWVISEFMKIPMSQAEDRVKLAYGEKSKPEIRISDKPLVPFSLLMQKAKGNGYVLTQ